jgi:hypothetical protein
MSFHGTTWSPLASLLICSFTISSCALYTASLEMLGHMLVTYILVLMYVAPFLSTNKSNLYKQFGARAREELAIGFSMPLLSNG